MNEVPLALAGRIERGQHVLDLALHVAAGETLAIVGPNGAGKTTLLHAIAGLLPLASGSLRIGGRVADNSSRSGFVPPEERRVGMVFQDQRLFPHLSVEDNIGFAAGPTAEARRAAARPWLQRIGLEDRAQDRPEKLSGGEKQRVALARALVTQPEVLLLDEPLAAVDVQRRTELRHFLQQELRSFNGARVVVTHDTVDAFTLGDRIAVLEDGRITQSGTAAEICAQPRSPFVANLVGVNLLRGQAEHGILRPADGAQVVLADSLHGPTLAVIHPRAVSLFPERPIGSPRNVWQAQVAAIEASGDRLRVRFGGPLALVAEVTPAALHDLKIEVGRALWLTVKATEIAAYPA